MRAQIALRKRLIACEVPRRLCSLGMTPLLRRPHLNGPADHRCSLFPVSGLRNPVLIQMSAALDPHHSATANVPEDVTGRPRRVATGGISFRTTFSAFKHRNFRLYFSGQLISFTGTWMTTTAQGWLVYQLTGSKALLGVVAAAASAPMLVFSTWGGWLADRYPKRSVIVCTQIS